MIASGLILIVLIAAATGLYFVGKKREKPDNVLDIEETEGIDMPKWKIWLKRVGVAGFMFFLIKGLVWLAIFAFAGKACL